jgi:hypothetical protein
LSAPRLSHITAGEEEISEITLGTLVKEVKTLKKKCDTLGREVEYLKARCETHENITDRGRKEILTIYQLLTDKVGTDYDGESYDLTK